jgi:hypothetical protein
LDESNHPADTTASKRQMKSIFWKSKGAIPMMSHESLCGTDPAGMEIFKGEEGLLHFFGDTACLLVRNVSRATLRQGDLVAWLNFGVSVIRFPPGRVPAGIIMAISVEPRDLFWLAIKNNVSEDQQAAVTAEIESSRLALTPRPVSDNNSGG